MKPELTSVIERLKGDFLTLKNSEDIKTDINCSPLINYIDLLFDLCEIDIDHEPIDDIKSILLALISVILYSPNQLRDKSHMVVSILTEPLDEQIRIAKMLMNARPYGNA